jgi:hypothetical protein
VQPQLDSSRSSFSFANVPLYAPAVQPQAEESEEQEETNETEIQAKLAAQSGADAKPNQPTASTGSAPRPFSFLTMPLYPPETAAGREAVQAKLAIGQPGDKYEQEADCMAAQVMRMPEPAKDAEESEAIEPQADDTVQRQPLASEVTPTVQLKADEPTAQTSAAFEQRLAGQQGGGQPLPDEVQTSMESKFQTRFDQVRVHTDAASVQMNKEVGAQAFTHGNDIYFNSGKYSPGSSGGQELLAHELTHTIQQTGGQVQARASLNRQRNTLQTSVENQSAPVQAKNLSGDEARLNRYEVAQNRNAFSQISQSSHIGKEQTSGKMTFLPTNTTASTTQSETENTDKSRHLTNPEAVLAGDQTSSDLQNISGTKNAGAKSTLDTDQKSAAEKPSTDEGALQTKSPTAGETTATTGESKEDGAQSPQTKQQTGAEQSDTKSAGAAEPKSDVVSDTQAVTEQTRTTTEEEKATVEQKATEAKAELEGEITSMGAESFPSLAELLEPGPEGTKGELESSLQSSSQQLNLQLPMQTAALADLGGGSKFKAPANSSNQTSFTSANTTSNQIAKNASNHNFGEALQPSGNNIIQMDAEPAAEQASDTDYDVEAARSSVRGIAGTINASADQAQQAIQTQGETISATLTANAAAMSQVIQAQVAQNIGSIREQFATQRTQLQTIFETARTQITTALEARKSEATTRGEQAKADFTQLFTDHRGRVETAVQDSVAAAEGLRATHEATARERLATQANEARQRGEARASGYGGDERGQAQAEAVRKVAEETAKEIEGRESEIIDAIQECVEGIPEEFENKGQEALQGFDEGLPDLLQGVDEQVQVVINNLTEQSGQVCQRLDSLLAQQNNQLDASEAAAINRVQSLEPQAQTQIQSSTEIAVTALNASAQQAVGQISPFVTQASQTLQSIEAPDVEKANQFAQQVISFATGASSEVTGGMQEVSNGMAQQSAQTEAAIGQSLQQNGQQTSQQLQAITESNQTTLSEFVTQVDNGFGQIVGSLDTAFLEVETQIDTRLSQALDELVQGFDQKLQEADTKLAEAVNEGLAKNDEALGQLDGKMQEAAREAAWRHDNPVLATLRDIAGFVAGLVIGIIAVLALVALVIVGFKVLIAGLVALGVSLLVAKIVAAVIGIGLLAYGIYQAYQARKEAGEEGGWGTFGMALLDLTGLTAIHRGVTQEGLSPFERGLAIGEGVGTLASFFLARGMNRRISNKLPRSLTNPIRSSFWQRFGRGRGNPNVPGPRTQGTTRTGWGNNNTSDIPNNNQTPVTSKVNGAPPVDAGKQGKHVLGHPNHGPSKSRWRSGVDHVYETQNAWQKGQPVPGQPQARSYRPGYVVGENGENSIKVHKNNQGYIHGVPHNRPSTPIEAIADEALKHIPAPLGSSIFNNLKESF